ncbi:hypothetical protein [Couchioplanes caeruleus]|uniref:Uncharacterized protein n=2 Tax=Couchioplanes caeruleus TaxID=56438 RepID=A0A1K0FK52_9ACTN|nr:hypothetical protein [Couchioplanes caeruleus]OJF13201.1 hypothetical protein BG844_16435 [Couchioplanes caeruleus subsp. caeruleus]ROP27761.1 hypothetical protein EDD30_0456 [Couchioplanes caeruleus]
MTADESVLAMADRLSAIDYARHGHRSWSKAALLKEYFRRIAQWVDAYGCDTRNPFFDLAQCIDPGIRADPEVVESVLRTVGRGPVNAITEVVPFILHWAALRGRHGADLPPDLDDPFEPLILLFERDGGFHFEKGFIELENLSVRVGLWRKLADRPPMPSFASEDLDAIDRAGSIAQFGYVVGPDD